VFDFHLDTTNIRKSESKAIRLQKCVAFAVGGNISCEKAEYWQEEERLFAGAG
jgi:hypothetical protein